MDFITNLLISTNWKDNNNNLILVIVDHLTKIVYYKSFTVTINVLDLVKVIINIFIYYHKFSKSIIKD